MQGYYKRYMVQVNIKNYWIMIIMKISIDKEICPEVFRIDEGKDIAVIIKKGLDEIDEECVFKAVESYPSDAIIILLYER
jgi:ferredoxin